ncbi:uncharacterized protein [Primulina huaijiensis]|uniref:uncharacterized protein isoform X1 n=1 Tax=Primulina huaijiensis TaxID=1492673 RepID=UPI003CC6E7ED
MGGAGQAMKRIPRIKFPQRHPKASAASQHQEMATNEAVGQSFFSRSPSNMSVGGKASDQPKRTPVSQEEIEIIMIPIVNRLFSLWTVGWLCLTLEQSIADTGRLMDYFQQPSLTSNEVRFFPPILTEQIF